MTPGRLLYGIYHRPRAALRRSWREGGLYQQWLDAQGAAEMRRAAWQLPRLPDFGAEPAVELHLVTGRAYAEQSVFCLWSFAHAAQRNIRPVFHDDGTFSPGLRERLRAVFPEARFVAWGEERLERHLPHKHFPVLRDRFTHYPHIRKLISVHLGETGWKLTLDSDLLFFRRPDFLLRWLEAPSEPLHLVDVADAYGYSQPLLEKLAGGPLPTRVNVGLCGLFGEALDWERIESWAARLIAAEGTHYLLEQTLVALLATGRSCAVAPQGDYLTLPGREEACAPMAVLHHYVAESKRWYFRRAWRHARGLFSPPGEKEVNNLTQSAP